MFEKNTKTKRKWMAILFVNLSLTNFFREVYKRFSLQKILVDENIFLGVTLSFLRVPIKYSTWFREYF